MDVFDGRSLSYQHFIDRYAYSRPVIFRGLTDNAKFQLLCSKSNLLRHYGGRRVRLSTANTYSYRKVDVPFQEYVDRFLKPQSTNALGSDTLYFFGDNNFTEWQSLFEHYEAPPYALPHTSGAYSFGIAGPGTGVPFHWHGPGFSEVVHGRKRWFLYPPDKEPHFHPNHTTLSWVTETYPHLPEDEAPLECTIRPGEVTGPGASDSGGPWGVSNGVDLLLLFFRCCSSPTAGGTPPSTWTPASSSPPSSAERLSSGRRDSQFSGGGQLDTFHIQSYR
ncbi:jmjC domain-containing protein 8-like isoform X2 [Echeneis naucrates]|nr:jmjC domain-containing protein 8-like isoform X2 [Echeneis naucrates]XP_029365408.1 jmjC domain-containing protein 8-like isoform X2 [Echeneis naucrates]